MMIEETLTPESLHATFFAQPEVEIEDEYHHSVSSVDGFTLSILKIGTFGQVYLKNHKRKRKFADIQLEFSAQLIMLHYH
jgi:hypothetical protein